MTMWLDLGCPQQPSIPNMLVRIPVLCKGGLSLGIVVILESRGGLLSMIVTCAYRLQNNKTVLSEIYDKSMKLASLESLISDLHLNLETLDRTFLCEAGLIASLHGGTVQYAGKIKKHTSAVWLASMDFRGIIDFYYSQYEWPFQIRFDPTGYLSDFVIEKLKSGYTVPLFTRQVSREPNKINVEAQERYAWESIKQVRESAVDEIVLIAR